MQESYRATRFANEPTLIHLLPLIRLQALLVMESKKIDERLEQP